MDEDVRQQIRQARGKFAAMAATYGLGVFNDSFFRQSAMLVAVAAGMGHMQGWIMAVFTLPYILFAAPAGWLADRFAKRRVVIAAKLLELAAMACGAVGICTGNWWFIVAMVFTMGLQSCLFSPALNGSIPELFPEEYVTKANATLKVVVTGMILAGVSASGPALELNGTVGGGLAVGRLVVALTALGISTVGVLVSLGVPSRPAASPEARFPWHGPLHTLRQLRRIRQDRLLSVVVAADVFVWFAGSVLIQSINQLAVAQYGWGKAMASYLVGAMLVGIAVGGLVGSRVAAGRQWVRLLPAGAVGMATVLWVMAAVPVVPGPWRQPVAFVVLAMSGVAGGLYLIPCEAFIQVRPAGGRKGTVIASANFAVFCGLLVSGPAANLLHLWLVPTAGMAVVAGCSGLVGLWLWRAVAEATER